MNPVIYILYELEPEICAQRGHRKIQVKKSQNCNFEGVVPKIVPVFFF